MVPATRVYGTRGKPAGGARRARQNLGFQHGRARPGGRLSESRRGGGMESCWPIAGAEPLRILPLHGLLNDGVVQVHETTQHFQMTILIPE